MRRLCLALIVLSIGWTGAMRGQTPDISSNDGVIGAWELVSYKYGEARTATDPSSARKSRAIKLMTKDHFVWVVYDLKKKIPSSSGGGTYSLAQGDYRELLEFGTSRAAALIGKEQSLKLKVEGDHMIESGTLSDGTKILEVWQRLP
jgi:hypothetical protein